MKTATIGLDPAKNASQVHGADVEGRAVLRKRLRRNQVAGFHANLPPRLLCEAWAHTGKPKSAQKNKVMADAMKLLFAPSIQTGERRLILAPADEEAAGHFKGDSRTTQVLRAHTIEIHVAALASEAKDSGRTKAPVPMSASQFRSRARCRITGMFGSPQLPLASLRRPTPRARIRIARKCRCVREKPRLLSARRRKHHMPGSSWRSKLMVRTSVAIPFESTAAATPQGDLPKSARSTNPQYQRGVRAIREETEHYSRDALHRPRNSSYSIENTGLPRERNPFPEVPRVSPSASCSDSAIRASAPRAGADVSRSEVHSEVPQKVTPWKNYVVEKTPLIGIYARQPVTPCGTQFQSPFLSHFSRRPGRLFLENLPRMVSRSVSSRSLHRRFVRFVPVPPALHRHKRPTPFSANRASSLCPHISDSRRFTCQPASPKITRPGAKLLFWDEAYKPRP